jgi:hypothetical protein
MTRYMQPSGKIMNHKWSDTFGSELEGARPSDHNPDGAQ